MKQELLLKQDLSKNSSPILVLSDLELEILLDESLHTTKEFYQRNPQHKRKGNYFLTSDFIARSRGVRGRVPDTSYIENPTIYIEKGQDSYSTQYNTQLDERIRNKLEQFRSRNRKQTADSFSRAFIRQRNWNKEKQLELASYLCQEQKAYLESRNPSDLKRIRQEDISKHFSYSVSCASRLMRNLTIQLPGGMVVYAKDLVPSNRFERSEGFYALQKLQKDPEYYKNGEWKVSDTNLRPILKKEFGVDLARRTIAKYRLKLGR